MVYILFRRTRWSHGYYCVEEVLRSILVRINEGNGVGANLQIGCDLHVLAVPSELVIPVFIQQDTV